MPTDPPEIFVMSLDPSKRVRMLELGIISPNWRPEGEVEINIQTLVVSTSGVRLELEHGVLTIWLPAAVDREEDVLRWDTWSESEGLTERVDIGRHRDGGTAAIRIWLADANELDEAG